MLIKEQNEKELLKIVLNYLEEKFGLLFVEDIKKFVDKMVVKFSDEGF